MLPPPWCRTGPAHSPVFVLAVVAIGRLALGRGWSRALAPVALRVAQQPCPGVGGWCRPGLLAPRGQAGIPARWVFPVRGGGWAPGCLGGFVLPGWLLAGRACRGGVGGGFCVALRAGLWCCAAGQPCCPAPAGYRSLTPARSACRGPGRPATVRTRGPDRPFCGRAGQRRRSCACGLAVVGPSPAGRGTSPVCVLRLACTVEGVGPAARALRLKAARGGAAGGFALPI